MNNLTTRKIVLGLLMTFVLAFSVQGTADAINELEAVAGNDDENITGDLGRVTAGQQFMISITVGLQDSADISNSIGQTDEDGNRINSDGYKVADVDGTPYRISAAAKRIKGYRSLVGDETPNQVNNVNVQYKSATGSYVEDSNQNVVDSAGRNVYTDTGRSDRATAVPDAPVAEGKRSRFNEEAIEIDIPSGITLTAPVRSTSDVTLTETADSADSNYLASDTTSITLTGFATSTGEKTIKIIDSTPSSDRPGDAEETLTFTIYVVKRYEQIPSSATTRLLNVTNGVGHGFYDSPVRIYKGDSSHYPVTYTIVGEGEIYVKEGDRDGTGFNEDGTGLMTSSGAEVYLRMRGSTNTVTADVDTSLVESKGVYIYGRPQIDPEEESVGPFSPGTLLTGASGDNLALTAKIMDSNPGTAEPVVGVPVKFEVANKRASGGTLFQATGTTIVNARNEEIKSPTSGSILYVRTGPAGGTATVDFQVGTGSGEQTITASALGLTKTFEISTTASEATRRLSVSETQSRQNNPNIFDLIALVENDGEPVEGASVRFTTVRGLLTNTPRGTQVDPTTSRETSKDVIDRTDEDGKAQVIYNLGDSSGGAEVVASVSVIDNNDTPIDVTDDTVTHLQEVIFNIRGGGTRPPSGPSEPSNAITITLSSTTGEPGDEIDVTVSSDPSAVVVIDSGDLDDADFSRLFRTTPFDTVISLPDEEGEYTFTAEAPRYTSDSATITVETGILGEISISQIGTPSNGAQSFSITVVDTDSARISGSLTVRVSGSGFTTRNVDTLNGIGNARLTLPTAASLYTLTASAEGYTSGTTQVRIAGTGQQQVADEDEEEVEEEVTVAAEPDSIEITGPSTRSGTVNEELDTPLLVRVLDDDGDGLEGARVFYRVISGRGRLSARGNGRAIGVVTDEDGYARAVFTPLDGGTITVRANTDDLSATVTFTITTGSASSASGARDSGTGGTPGMISPVVHVGAASRPPMLWVDGGAIYALVGASPQRFAASVDNALNIAVGGGKVYWTEKTGESGGTINSANLNGSGVTELASILAVPMGIAVDTAGSKLYWTNSRGRIQSADLDGSGITNVMLDLPSPMDLALAGGNAYWTQGNGSVRFVNLRGQKVVRNVSTGTDTPGSLVIGGGKVYWTEMTGESGGTVNSANLNGTGATPLASILAAPMGIAVDGSRSKLYWSNSRGRIQSANLDGSKIQNVVSGLGSPSELVLSNSIATPTAAATTTTTTASNAKYDVNSDGSVDNTDAGLVADAMGTSNARYDVNGDGTVNFLDLLLVFDNRDVGAAGAPTVVGMKLSAAQIDIIEEQIDLLIATNDRSPAAMRTLIYLQQLLVTARPEKTQLLANYPNPFNPETWIPYELATDTNVRLTIYNTQGVVIRSLQFGHQSAGYYVGRDRAAYWDGRNALGEQVASGLYFYQLETDEMSLMRKMVILK